MTVGSLATKTQAAGPALQPAPAQPKKALVGVEVAASLTSMSSRKRASQTWPQSIPSGVERTTPLPWRFTSTRYSTTLGAGVGVAFFPLPQQASTNTTAARFT